LSTTLLRGRRSQFVAKRVRPTLASIGRAEGCAYRGYCAEMAIFAETVEAFWRAPLARDEVLVRAGPLTIVSDPALADHRSVTIVNVEGATIPCGTFARCGDQSACSTNPK
jgi:hypothetical protein